MAGIDKAAIGWTIAIVAAGVGIALMGSSIDSVSVPEFAPPNIAVPSTSEDRIKAAKEQIAREQEERMMQDSDMDMKDMEDETMRMEEEEERMRMEEEKEMMRMEEEEERMRMEEEKEMMRMEEEERMRMEEEEERMRMEEEERMRMEEEDQTSPMNPATGNAGTGSQTHMVSMPQGAGIPGCEDSDTCYVPTDITVNAGDTVVWTNDESVPHTVTAGDLGDDPNTVGTDYHNGFDSQFMTAGVSFEHTFGEPGMYPYFCQLHPWMVGTVHVN